MSSNLSLSDVELAAVRACVTRCWIHREKIDAKPEGILIAAQAVHEPGIREAAATALQALRDSEEAQLNFERLLSANPQSAIRNPQS